MGYIPNTPNPKPKVIIEKPKSEDKPKTSIKPEIKEEKVKQKKIKRKFIPDIINLNRQQNRILHLLADNNLPLDIWSIHNFWNISEEEVKKELQAIMKFHEIKIHPGLMSNGSDGYLLQNKEKYWKSYEVYK